MGWEPGDVIVHREVWRGTPWQASPVVVVDDGPGLLATYIPEEAPFAFPPSADGRPHPWAGRGRWSGHGVLVLRRPGEAYSVWHFWDGPERRFVGWYLNLEEPFRRTAIGYDTQDLELDIWIPAGGRWEWKDADVLEQRIAEGRYTRAQVEAAWAEGHRVVGELDAGRRWWDPWWALWEPDPAWDRRYDAVSA